MVVEFAREIRAKVVSPAIDRNNATREVIAFLQGITKAAQERPKTRKIIIFFAIFYQKYLKQTN